MSVSANFQQQMTPITRGETSHRKAVNPTADNDYTKRSEVPTVGWLVPLHSSIPADMLEYFEWTIWIENQVRNGKLYNGIY